MLLSLFRRLPFPLRSAAASLRGYYLGSWRYGSETDRLATEALEREHWSAAQWRGWQAERLAFVLRRAATRVPYYRNYWAQRQQVGDRASWTELENWPVLEKDALRANPRAFIADDCDLRKMFHEHTSGTTGKPLDLWWSRETVRAWYALFEARVRRWHGLSRHDRWAILGGQLICPGARRRPPFWVWNAGLNQLYLSSYHLAPDLIPYYLDALRRYRIRYLLGYSSSLYEVAQGAIRRRNDPLKMKVAVTNAEPLYSYQRETISKAFQCPTQETYGMAEIVTAASECEAGRLHVWPETGFVEVLDGGVPLSPGSSGELVCTSLLNADMPLIRYRVGDRAAFRAADHSCPCGRSLPWFSLIEGRTDDVLYTADGRVVGRLDPIFKADLPVHEAQIIQESLGQIRVRYVPTNGYGSAAGEKIIGALKARMGNVQVTLEPLSKVPRTANGKFRAVICNLSREERMRLNAYRQHN